MAARSLKWIKLALPILAVAAGAGTWFMTRPGPLQFQSAESHTLEDGPVFNRILYVPGLSKDIWMMQQSHQGAQLPHAEWDRLAIVVDKSSSTATFYQVAPGKLEWEENMPAAPRRASCFMCHPNGPRAIRPEEGSMTLAQKALVFAWNLRIKSYGRITAQGDPHSDHLPSSQPFRYSGGNREKPLEVAACIRCHHEGTFGRGQLTYNARGSIKFLTEKGHMPPLGLEITETDKRQLWKFVRGL